MFDREIRDERITRTRLSGKTRTKRKRGRNRRRGGKEKSGKGVKLAFWGVLAKEVDPGAKRHPGEDQISRDATKTQFASRHSA